MSTEADQADQIATLAQMPDDIVRRFPRPAFIRRCRETGFLEWSTEAFVDDIRHLTSGLETLGLQPGERVAIMSESRPEWVIADLAILRSGAVTVPIYPTLAAGQASYILNDSGARLAFVSDRAQLAKLQEVRHVVPQLGLIIVIDPDAGAASDPAADGAAPLGASVLPFSDVIQRGRDLLGRDATALTRQQTRADRVTPAELATIIYTSGTSGEPKGVMLTHHNIVSNLPGCHFAHVKTTQDIALSFLPLSHAFERTVILSYLLDGVSIVFAEAIDTLPRDMIAAKP